MSTTFLILGLLSLGAAAATWFPARRLGPLTPVYFLVAWVVGELALQTIALQAVVTLLFVAGGALDRWPGVVGLAAMFAGWGFLVATHVRSHGARSEVSALARAHGLEPELDEVSPFHGFLHPFRMRKEGVRRITDVAYGASLPGDKGRRNLLDIYLPEASGERRPVLLQIHGGAWIIGDKREQALPLMNHLASRGWVCFSINYRLSPQATFPDHVVDVKRALAWIRENAAEYGGDPDFICVTGGSAGGHLTALTALSAGDLRFQPGFEAADTSVSAAVPFYGVYDWLDRAGDRGSQSMAPFLTERVLKASPESDRELWEAGSPITHISSDAPPFLAIQGTHDTLVYVEEARTFMRALEEKSQEATLYLEMTGAQHAFDMFHSVRSACAVRAATAFLEKVRSDSESRRLAV